VTIPPISLRDFNLDGSSRAIGGTAWLDGSGWTVSTGGSSAAPVIARSDTPGVTALMAGAAGGSAPSLALWAGGALLVLLLLRALR
jgi:hypothetical protein